MRLLEFLKTRSYETSKQEELLYEFVATELETGSLSKGLWIKALAETGFDDARARALYIKLHQNARRIFTGRVTRNCPTPQANRRGTIQTIKIA